MKELFIFVLIVCAVLASVVYTSYWFGKEACEAYGESTGKYTEYNWPAGCFIEYNEEMVIWEEYQYRLVAKEQVE